MVLADTVNGGKRVKEGKEARKREQSGRTGARERRMAAEFEKCREKHFRVERRIIGFETEERKRRTRRRRRRRRRTFSVCILNTSLGRVFRC